MSDFNTRINLDVVATGLNQANTSIAQLESNLDKLSSRQIELSANGILNQLSKLSSTSLTFTATALLDQASVDKARTTLQNAFRIPESNVATNFGKSQSRVIIAELQAVTNSANNMSKAIDRAQYAMRSDELARRLPTYLRDNPISNRVQTVQSRLNQLQTSIPEAQTRAVQASLASLEAQERLIAARSCS